MPNWCDNSLELSHEDKSKMDALDAVLTAKEAFFQHLVPNPSGEWEYNWSIENWGTKWDADAFDWERTDDNTIRVYFNTAWSPPIALYDNLVEQGYKVDARYHECGMCYAGQYTTDGGDDYYEYDVSDQSTIDALPADVVDFAGLEDAHERWVIEDLEERWSEAERTDWIPASTPPVREGWYEVKTSGWDFAQFCKYDELLEWNSYNTVTFWRGLAEEPNEAEVD
jgi:hypothetical protein